VAQLYPRSLGSLFIASYDSQGYGGEILTLLHVSNNMIIVGRVVLYAVRVVLRKAGSIFFTELLV
jgi:hypothetical protein